MNSGTGGPVPGDIDRTHMVTTLMIISWIIDFKSLDIFTLLFFFFHNRVFHDPQERVQSTTLTFATLA